MIIIPFTAGFFVGFFTLWIMLIFSGGKGARKTNSRSGIYR